MAFENRYSGLDRALHTLAFRTAAVQVELAGLEDKIHAKQLASQAIDRPVFITALPRAGTTFLLQLCVDAGAFATHTYREMPFVMVPLLWSRFSKRFQQDDVPRERAHGDGMLVSADSPEAFEEVLWKAFFPDHYEADRIRPWDSAADEDFNAFFRAHVRKILLLADSDGAAPPDRRPDRRYVSKNNLNIARVPALKQIFPESVIVVPFREPLQHAASLLRQHLNFLTIHRSDAFARDYMAGIGHFDFGENLRPVDFDGWLDTSPDRDPTTLAFWLRYWVAAYRFLSERAGDQIRFLDYDGMCATPAAVLSCFADMIGTADPESLIRQADRITAAPTRDVPTADISGALLEAVGQLHADLRRSFETP